MKSTPAPRRSATGRYSRRDSSRKRATRLRCSEGRTTTTEPRTGWDRCHRPCLLGFTDPRPKFQPKGLPGGSQPPAASMDTPTGPNDRPRAPSRTTSGATSDHSRCESGSRTTHPETRASGLLHTESPLTASWPTNCRDNSPLPYNCRPRRCADGHTKGTLNWYTDTTGGHRHWQLCETEGD